jgi:hypothetical protein
MPGLYDILTQAEDGETMAVLGREFRLAPQHTDLERRSQAMSCLTRSAMVLRSSACAGS